jgi:hypothetical protein
MLKELEPLAAQYARSRETLYKCLDQLSAAQAEELLPDRDWSIKDTLIHLVTNETLMTALLRDIEDGDANSLPDDFDNQKFNDESVAAGRAKSVAELRAELDASYNNLLAVLETVTPETITRRGTHPAAGDSDVKEFLVAMYAHHEVHCRDVVEQTRRLKKVS